MKKHQANSNAFVSSYSKLQLMVLSSDKLMKFLSLRSGWELAKAAPMLTLRILEIYLHHHPLRDVIKTKRTQP